MNQNQSQKRPIIHLCSRCYKTFLEEIQISPKLRYRLKFVLMSEPSQKCDKNAIIKQNFTQNFLFILKYPIFAVLALGEIQNFQISSKKVLKHRQLKSVLGSKQRFKYSTTKISLENISVQSSVTDWVIFWTLRNFLKLLATMGKKSYAPLFTLFVYFTH